MDLLAPSKVRPPHDFWGPQIRAGAPVRWAYLTAPTAPIDERDIAAVAVRVLDIEEASPETSGLPRFLLDAWASALGQPAYISSTFADLTGRSPFTFRDWVSANLDAFQPS
jgi:hypothetical protein